MLSRLIPRIGIAVQSSADGGVVGQVVAVRGEHVLWDFETPASSEASLGGVLTAAVAECRRRQRWGAPHVVVALDSAYTQVKSLPGLPAVDDLATLATVVRENTGRFFLRNGVPVIPSGLRRDQEGAVWAAAIERSVLGEVATACRTGGATLEAVVPTAATVNHPLPRAHASDAVRPLFAAAYSAAVGGGREPIAWRRAAWATVMPNPVHIRPKWWRAAAYSVGAAAAVAILIFLLARAHWVARHEGAYLQSVHGARAKAAEVRAQLATTSATLDAINTFGDRRPLVTALLATLGHALPPQTALMALRTDSVGGSFVALTPKAEDLVHALESVPMIAAPEIVGPVTRPVVPTNAVGGAASSEVMDQVMMRFRWAQGRASR